MESSFQNENAKLSKEEASKGSNRIWSLSCHQVFHEGKPINDTNGI